MLAVTKLMHDFSLQLIFIVSPVLSESGVCQLVQSKIVAFYADFYAYLFVMLISLTFWLYLPRVLTRVLTRYQCTVVSSIGCD